MEYKDMPVDVLLRNTRMYPGCVIAGESAAELGRRLTQLQGLVRELPRLEIDDRDGGIVEAKYLLPHKTEEFAGAVRRLLQYRDNLDTVPREKASGK